MPTWLPLTVGTVLVPAGPGSRGAISWRAVSLSSTVPRSMNTPDSFSVCPATILASSWFPASVITKP